MAEIVKLKYKLLAFSAWAVGIPLCMYGLRWSTSALLGQNGPALSTAFAFWAIVFIAWQGVMIATGRSGDAKKLQKYFGIDGDGK